MYEYLTFEFYIPEGCHMVSLEHVGDYFVYIQ